MMIYPYTRRRPEAGRTSRARRHLMLGIGSLFAAALFLASSMPAFSAGSGTVTASVTPTNAACITLDKTSLDFGPVQFSTPETLQGATRNVAVTNCGTSAASLFARGSDASNANGSVSWTLDGSGSDPCNASTPLNLFMLSVNQPASNSGVFLTKLDQQLAGTVGAGAAFTVMNHLFMPCTGSGGAGGAMAWQIVYTATA